MAPKFDGDRDAWLLTHDPQNKDCMLNKSPVDASRYGIVCTCDASAPMSEANTESREPDKERPTIGEGSAPHSCAGQGSGNPATIDEIRRFYERAGEQDCATQFESDARVAIGALLAMVVELKQAHELCATACVYRVELADWKRIGRHAQKLEADNERLREEIEVHKKAELYLIGKLDKAIAAIESAPHEDNCIKNAYGKSAYPCDCWKAKALKEIK